MEHRKDYGEHVAQLVSAAIAASDLSQRDVSERSGIPLASLNRRLNGYYPFDVAQIFAIAAALQVPVSRLYPDEVA